MKISDDITIEETLAAYLKEECLPRNSVEKLTYSQNLFEAGIVDSAGLISFIGFVEMEFRLTVPDEDLLPEHFVSLSAVANYIRSRQQVQHVSGKEMRRVGS
jgi:acyl carrier protein